MIERYTRPEIGRIWSDEHRYGTWLAVETAAAEAMAEHGIIPREAARDISWDAFRDWGDSERLLVNIETCYREFANDVSERNIVNLFTLMARWRKQQVRLTSLLPSQCA